MSEPVLAPEEIEALMAEVDSSEHTEAMFASLPPVQQPEQVDAFHFSDSADEGPSQYPMFVNLQERMVEIMDEEWDEMFQRDITIQVARLDSTLYKDLISITEPQVYFVFEVEAYGRMMFTFDTAIIVAFVDAMLGGDGEATDDPQTLSPVELRLAERIAIKLAAMLGEVWGPVHPMEFKPYKIDYDPQFLAVTGAMEKCFSTYFEAQLSDTLTGNMGVHYPRPFLEPMLELLRATVSDEPKDTDHEWHNSLMQCISNTPADLRFELGRSQMDIGSFLKLKPGDMLPFTTRASSPCSLWVEDIALFLAKPGEQLGSLAAEIIEPIQDGGVS